jgi:hypothetical protein
MRQKNMTTNVKAKRRRIGIGAIPALAFGAAAMGIGGYMTTISLLAGGPDVQVRDPMVNTQASMGIMVGNTVIGLGIAVAGLALLAQLGGRWAARIGAWGSLLIGGLLLALAAWQVPQSDLRASWPAWTFTTLMAISAIWVGVTKFRGPSSG